VIEQRFAESVQLLRDTRKKNGYSPEVRTVAVSDSQRILHHNFDKSEAMHDFRSLSKVVTCLGVGAILEHGVEMKGKPLTLNTAVGDFFRDLKVLQKIELAPRWSQVRLVHLLSNTIGHQEGFLFSKDINENIKRKDRQNLLEYIFRAPLNHVPGEHFVYSNVGTFLVSVLLQELTGKQLASWIEELVFTPLGFTNYDWKAYAGYTAGCTGLKGHPLDLHKIGELLRDNGLYQGQRIVSDRWIDTMRSPMANTPAKFISGSPLPKSAYGLGLWLCPNGIYYCNGANGQFLIVLPQQQIVISVASTQGDTKSITECFRNFFSAEHQ